MRKCFFVLACMQIEILPTSVKYMKNDKKIFFSIAEFEYYRKRERKPEKGKYLDF